MEFGKKGEKRDEIVVIGMACRFPKADNYREFWQNLQQGINSISEITPEHWDIDDNYSSDARLPNKTYSKWGGLVNNFDSFDNHFFNISPREASNIDPQQRLLLEETWHCIEDSGVPLSKLQKKKTGVYVGLFNMEYLQRASDPEVFIDSYTIINNYQCFSPNRLSYFLNLNGPSIAIDTGCASSSTGIHLAKELLLAGKIDYALTAGVSLTCHPSKYISLSKSYVASLSGQCKTFDASADGYVPAEGVGALLLQRKSEALSERNHIYGIIKASAINHGGKAVSVTAPNVKAQKEVILEAYQDAGISPEDTSYLEAHGTGTSLGDPIEIEALTRAFGQYTSKKQFCKIGSLKSNIGHSEPVSGIAGIIKVLMMMEHKKIPASLNIKTVNPIINFTDSPFKIARQLEDWPSDELAPLRAGISSFGLGGANSHIILESFNKKPDESAALKDKEQKKAFALSAKSPEALEKMLENWKSFVKSDSFLKYKLKDVAGTLNARESFSYRYGSLVKNAGELEETLNKETGYFSKNEYHSWKIKIGKLDELSFADFQTLKRQNSPLGEKIREVIEELELTGDQPGSVYSFLVYYAYFLVLKDFGFTPGLAEGENGGFWLALAVSGVLTCREAVDLIAGRANAEQLKFRRPQIPLLDPVSKQVLTPLRFDAKYVEFMSRDLNPPDDFSDYYINKARLLSQNQFTFKKYLNEWSAVLKSLGVETEDDIFEVRPLSLLLAITLSCLNKLNRKWDLTRKIRDGGLKLYEMADLATDQVLDKEDLVKLLTNQGNHKLIAEKLNQNQERLNLQNSYQRLREHNQELNEISDVSDWVKKAVGSQKKSSPSGNFCLLAKANNSEKEFSRFLKPVLDEAKADSEFKEIFLDLWLRGVDIKWGEIYPEGGFKKTALPAYPFKRERFWLEKLDKPPSPGQAPHPLLDKAILEFSLNNEGVCFQKTLKPKDLITRDHQVKGRPLFPGAGFIEAAYAALNQTADQNKFDLCDAVFINPLWAEEETKYFIRLQKEDDKIKYRIGAGVEDKTLVYTQGEFRPKKEAPAQEKFSLEGLKDSFVTTKEKDQFYSELKEVGLEYGPSFQTVQQARFKEGEALGLLELDQRYKERFQGYRLVPCLLDGALQLSVLLNQSSKRLKLPFALEKLEVFSPLKERAWVYLKETGENKFNLAVLNHEGEPALKIYGFSLREAKKTETGDDFYYLPQWIAAPELSAEEKFKPSGESTLIVSNGNDFGLAESLAEFHDSDQTLQIKTDQTSILADPLKRPQKIDLIYFLGGIQTQTLKTDQWSRLENTQKEGIIDLFRLMTVLSEQGFLKKKLKLKIVANNVFKIEDEPVIPDSAALLGFVRSLAREYKKLEVGYLDLALNDLKRKDLAVRRSLAEAVVGEPFQRELREIAYRDGQRSRRVIAPIFLPSFEESLFKEKGSYLILGGAGGIGLELSEYLAKTKKAGLILIGRSRLSEEKAKRLDKIRNLGSEVVYLRAEASNFQSLKKAVDQGRSAIGKIDGAINSALELEDKLFAQMSEEDLQKSLGPKVRGGINLARALAGDSLDFMLFFSSLQSFWGNVGQSNYAAASVFQDVWADYLGQELSCPVKVVNWGYWGTVGIVADQTHRKLMSAQGFGSIVPEEGMEAIERILSCPAPQVAAVKAARPILETMGFDFSRRLKFYPSSVPSLAGLLAEQANLSSSAEKMDEFERGFKKLEKLAPLLLLKTFQERGILLETSRRTRTEDIREAVGVIPKYRPLWEAMLDIFERAGLVKFENPGELAVSHKTKEKDFQEKLSRLDTLKGELRNSYPDLEAYVDLLSICLGSCFSMLRGEAPYSSVLFPQGSLELVEKMYRGNASADCYNQLTAELVALYLEKRFQESPDRKIKILEAGAGTGATSRVVMEKIKGFGDKVVYYYTDISPRFLNHAEETFKADYPFIEPRLFNIENDPSPQGFDPGSVDLVLSVNMMHATSNIARSLAGIKKVLKKRGILLLGEVLKRSEFMTLTFGFADGWWLAEDSDQRIKRSASLDSGQWRRRLSEGGFAKAGILGFAGKEESAFGQRVILAESDGLILEMEETYVDQTTETPAEPPTSAPESAKPASSQAKVEKKVAIQDAPTPVYNYNPSKESLKYLRGIFSRILKIDESKITADETFENYGIDSLMIMEVTNRLEKDFGSLSATLLFERSTLRKLGAYFIAEHSSRLEELLRPAPDAGAPAGADIKNLFADPDFEETKESLAEDEAPVVPTTLESESESTIEGDHKQILMTAVSEPADDVAVIGLSGRYPQAENLKRFWKNLESGKDCVSEIPTERWEWREHYRADGRDPALSYSKWGAFLEDADKFDSRFFNITPREAQRMDPQERLFLETVWTCLEDAGYAKSALAGSRTGVFVGIMNSDYDWLSAEAWLFGKILGRAWRQRPEPRPPGPAD